VKKPSLNLFVAVSEITAGGNTLGQAGMSKMLAERRGGQLEAKGLVRGSKDARKPSERSVKRYMSLAASVPEGRAITDQAAVDKTAKRWEAEHSVMSAVSMAMVAAVVMFVPVSRAEAAGKNSNESTKMVESANGQGHSESETGQARCHPRFCCETTDHAF
jgi:hypothetical protein